MNSHPLENGASGSPTSRPTAEAPPPDLSLRGVTKRFPHVLANDNIDLDIHCGEVHAILGENGAGKSTLMKILYGFYQPDSGTISRAGVPIRIHSPREGRQHGIGMVFQDFTLVPALTVTENIALVVPYLPPILPMQALEEEIRALSERYHFRIDPRAPVYDLSIGEQQKVEIIKLLLAKAQFLIFDEPTSVLAPHEIDELLEVFRQLRRDGLAVLFITHKLREVLAVVDRITVLRRGKVTATQPATDATEAGLVALMLGSTSQAGTEATVAALPPALQDVQPRSPTAQNQSETPVLDIRDANVPDPAGRVHLHDVSLSISPGEIVGVAAVSGHGQKELGELVQGLRHCHSGSVKLLDTGVRRWSPIRTVALGVACVPEDPLREGAVPTMTVLENMVLPVRKQFTGQGGLSIHWRRARDYVVRALQSFGLRMPALEAPIGTLSGGNIQRVVFAREAARQPKLLLSYYPTRGMDVPSANITRQLLRGLRAAGTAILLVSEDLDELLSLSDRLVVMHRGRIVGTFRTDEEPSLHSIGLLMTGGEHATTGVQTKMGTSNG
ncbi:MAG: ABC transporter ATP-binding protein [Chloroflexi bacterium]|nr:MAG: ABC transporter ATP-binding protein [Chloroflexota bacterium]